MNTTTKLMTLLLAFILPASVFALPPYSYTNYEFAVDGIYYKIVDNEACVTYQEYRSGMHLSDYHGDVVIPAQVTYQDVTYPVTTIDYYAFNYCQGLTSITIPESITTIKDCAFYLCTSLTCVNLLTPSVVIEKHAFSNCTALTTIICPSTTPPAMYYEECFDSPHYESATLHVPASAVESYRNAPVWKKFVHIQAIDNQPSDETDYLSIVREGVKWVNEKVIVDHGDTTCYYYNYEFCGYDSIGLNNLVNEKYNACYYYTGEVLDTETDSLIAGLSSIGKNTYCGRNDAYWHADLDFHLNQLLSLDREVILMYPFDMELYGPDEYYIAMQASYCPPDERYLTSENFHEIEPIEVEDLTCRRWAYVKETGDTMCYVVEGIGFDSRDMGDLLTPFTHRPDPTADHQEWCGLSHVIKDGKIIYKGMRYNPNAIIVIPGDVNGDGEVNIGDANSVIDIVVMGGNNGHTRIPAADMNGDNEITIADFNAIIDIILKQQRE